MEIRTIKDCFKLRLLRKIASDKEKTKKSLEIAEDNLKDAKVGLNHNLFKFAVMSSYMAMFHAARAVLYHDGIQEKNHFAVYIYLKEKYRGELSEAILNLLNIHRIERHEAIYGLEYVPEKEDAKTAIQDARVFINEIKRILTEEK